MSREVLIRNLETIHSGLIGGSFADFTIRAAIRRLELEGNYPEWMGPGPHYVVATEDDSDPNYFTTNKYGQPIPKHPWGRPSMAIVHEHEIPNATSLEGAKQRAEILKGRYGRQAIFRLVLVEDLP